MAVQRLQGLFLDCKFLFRLRKTFLGQCDNAGKIIPEQSYILEYICKGLPGSFNIVFLQECCDHCSVVVQFMMQWVQLAVYELGNIGINRRAGAVPFMKGAVFVVQAVDEQFSLGNRFPQGTEMADMRYLTFKKHM